MVFCDWLLLHTLCFQGSSMLQHISTLFLFMAKRYSLVWIYCIFLDHLLVSRHFCFHFWAITNNAAINIHEQDFVWIYYCSSQEWSVTFWGIARLCSKVAAPFYNPTAVLRYTFLSKQSSILFRDAKDKKPTSHFAYA